MKKVFSSHSEVCHVWASQSQENGSSTSVFFDGGSIYSYGRHFKIAEFVDSSTVLFNSGGYSVSTSKHQGHVRSAIPSRCTVFTVPNLSTSALSHSYNLAYYESEIRGSIGKASRARSLKAIHLNYAEQALEEAKSYCKRFKLKLFKIDEIPSREKLAEFLVEFKRLEVLKAKKAKAKRIRDMAKDKKLWLAGEKQSLLNYPETLLRIKGAEVQTSKGANFSVIDAVKAFKFVELVIKSGKEWKRNGQTFQVGYYQIDLISAKGDVKAGCHFIRQGEIARIGKELEK